MADYITPVVGYFQVALKGTHYQIKSSGGGRRGTGGPPQGSPPTWRKGCIMDPESGICW